MITYLLLAFGIVLLVFALAFRKRHVDGYQHMMQHNQNVQPLFKERSAAIKYDTLLHQFEGDPERLRRLIELRDGYISEKLDVVEYEKALDDLHKS